MCGPDEDPPWSSAVAGDDGRVPPVEPCLSERFREGAGVEIWIAVAGSPTALPARAKAPIESATAKTNPAAPSATTPSMRFIDGA